MVWNTIACMAVGARALAVQVSEKRHWHHNLLLHASGRFVVGVR